MDFLQKRSLDCPNNSIRTMGVVLLYSNLDDVQLHRRLVQGKSLLTATRAMKYF